MGQRVRVRVHLQWHADNVKWNVYIFICFIWNAISIERDVKRNTVASRTVVHLKVDTFQCMHTLNVQYKDKIVALPFGQNVLAPCHAGKMSCLCHLLGDDCLYVYFASGDVIPRTWEFYGLSCFSATVLSLWLLPESVWSFFSASGFRNFKYRNCVIQLLVRDTYPHTDDCVLCTQ